MSTKENIKIIDETYLHLYNGGVTFKVEDRGLGPTVVIRSSTFGNLNQEFSFMCDRVALKVLGEMFQNAFEQEFSEDYCYKVQHMDPSEYYRANLIADQSEKIS